MPIILPPCRELPPSPEPVEITFPGAATLSSIQQEVGKIQSIVNLPFNMMSQAGPVLAAVKPVFDIIETMKAIQDCQNAVTDSITQLSPQPVLDCIPNLAKRVDVLLKLIPQLSVPLMIVGILDTVLTVLDGLLDFLSQLGFQFASLANRIERAQDVADGELDAILECADSDLQNSLSNALKAISPVTILLNFVNKFLELIEQDPIELEDLDPDIPLEETIAPIREIIDIVKQVREAIPV